MIATKEKNKMTEQNISKKTFDVLDEKENIIGEETAVDSTEANNSKKVADVLNGEGSTSIILNGLNQLCAIRFEAGKDYKIEYLDKVESILDTALRNALLDGRYKNKRPEYGDRALDARAELVDFLEDAGYFLEDNN